MYKLLIVDDEKSTRTGLRDYFDWKEYNVHVVGVAINGVEALDKIPELKPDIVLTDIKMQSMDGIELASKIKEQYKNIKIIFISGYDDIEYIKSALKLEAIDYILKPISFEELEAVIKRVVTIIKEEEIKKKAIDEMEEKLFRSMPLLREKFLMSLIRKRKYSSDVIEEKLKFLGLSFPVKALFCSIVINVDDYVSQFEGMTELEGQSIAFGIMNICQELINKDFDGYIFENSLEEYVGILNLKDMNYEEKLLKLASEIKEVLVKFLNISVTIGIGKTVETLAKVHQSYDMAYQAVSHKFFLGKNKIITMDTIDTSSDDAFVFDIHLWEKISLTLKAGKFDRILDLFDKLFNSMKQSRKSDIRYLKNICMQLLLNASRLLMELEIKSDKFDITGVETNENKKNLMYVSGLMYVSW